MIKKKYTKIIRRIKKEEFERGTKENKPKADKLYTSLPEELLRR